MTRHAISATHATIHAAPGQPQRDWRSIRPLIDAAGLPERARERAQEAFKRLAHAEARIHDVDPEQVHFHEVGAVDAIGEVCGVALALEDLGIDRVVCSPLPVGRGFVKAAHGRLPLPAPAALALLEGAPIYGVEVETELVTPTGAALVAALAAGYGPLPRLTLETVGYGAGTRDGAELPNVVRAIVGAETGAASRPVSLIEANLDDLIPELAPDAAAACFAAGALDVWTAPAQMKHGRPGFVLSALTRPHDEEAVATAMLRETSTLGVRIARLDRIELERESRTVEVAGEPVRVKVGRLDGQGRQPGARACRLRACGADQRRAREDRVGAGARGRARGGLMTLLSELERSVARHESAVVAFSGGVDSSLVAAVAARALGPRALAVTAVSPAVAAGELEGARRVAAAVGIAHETIATDELARDGYRRNGSDRCYFCKSELYDTLAELAARRGFHVLLSGANADDAGDWRPGLRAAAEHGVRHPLLDAGAGKAEVRALARELGVPSADKPATPCLASRIPYGTAVDPETLARIDRAEQAVRALGFPVLRVRHHGILGRLEVAADDLDRAFEREPEIVAAIRAAGYVHAVIDREPFRSGRLNAVLRQRA